MNALALFAFLGVLAANAYPLAFTHRIGGLYAQVIPGPATVVIDSFEAVHAPSFGLRAVLYGGGGGGAATRGGRGSRVEVVLDIPAISTGLVVAAGYGGEPGQRCVAANLTSWSVCTQTDRGGVWWTGWLGPCKRCV